jgi:hypothetical protein
VAVPSKSLLEVTSIEAIAREVAQLLGRREEPAAGGLLTAREVAARFNVDRTWVYAHADELGVVRLGQGPRPRLRFDPAVVAQRLVAPPGRPVAPIASTQGRAGAPLLPIRPSRGRRTLDSDR